jgi:hypothetical protein
VRPLSAPELLDAWERGLGALPFEQALALLSAACPESSQEDLTRLSIGRRDARLLQLREWAFGPELTILASCPRCHLQLESVLKIADLYASAGGPQASDATLIFEEYELRCRAPDSYDLAACRGLDNNTCRQTLLARCLIESRYRDRPIAADELPGAVLRAATERIARLDPQAEILVDLACPECAHRWNELFDIVCVFWAEIDAWARRLLREVHILASRYGWTEQEILPLSPLRRQIYLGMAQA